MPSWCHITCSTVNMSRLCHTTAQATPSTTWLLQQVQQLLQSQPDSEICMTAVIAARTSRQACHKRCAELCIANVDIMSVCLATHHRVQCPGLSCKLTITLMPCHHQCITVKTTIHQTDTVSAALLLLYMLAKRSLSRKLCHHLQCFPVWISC